MGALILRAQAVNPVMKVFQVNLLIVLKEGREGRGGGRIRRRGGAKVVTGSEEKRGVK